MSSLTINQPALFFTGNHLIGEGVESATRRAKDLKGIFRDTAALDAMSPDAIVYEVKSFLPVPEGTPGGLYFGITSLYPGKVGDEYFMTKGHFHAARDRAEFYWGLTGEGMLLFMDGQRNVRAEKMSPGSLHYIPGGVAHRVANTGDGLLSFAACWPSDAGHNYGEIAENGFAGRLICIKGFPELVLI
ncbi:MAG: cupin domain-containing protein [Tannerella sp.]|jgi:glucose-6-phosphate isomerase|nr:cupin domain-containing protein [Tannerella sp.]